TLLKGPKLDSGQPQSTTKARLTTEQANLDNGGAQGAVSVRREGGSDIPVNPAEVDTGRALQNMVNRSVAALAESPELARDLMSPGSYRHLVERTNLADASYGKAVERLTARYIGEDPSLSNILQY